MPESTHVDVDVAVIGGGPAGLSAATALARSLRSVIVIDDDRPRNAPAAGAHNLLGHDGIPPRELLAKGRTELAGYGGQVRAGVVRAARRTDSGFELELVSGDAVHARRLVLATGLIDELPDIAGVRELWGTDVLHCPYCHGWEVRGKRIVVIGTGPMATHQALLFRQLSDDVTLIDHAIGALDESASAQLSALGVEIVDDRVERVEVRRNDDGSTKLDGLTLASGTRIDADAVVVGPRFHARTDLYEQLGGSPAPHPIGVFIETDAMGQTDIPGVWAAGNSSNLSAMVSVSMGSGLMAGAAVNADLVAEDARRAVESANA